jgi:hypothetical protein
MFAKRLIVPAACLAVFVGLTAILDRDLVAQTVTTDTQLSREEIATLEETVRSFNAVLQDFYATGGNPALIDEMPATKSVKHFIFRDLGYLQQSGLILVYDLASLTVISGRATGHDIAELVVYEEWNYVYQQADDRRPVSQLKGTGLGIRYRLTRLESGWMVADWNPETVATPAVLAEPR